MLTVTIRVTPGASRSHVGGAAEGGALKVRVTAPAIGGRATQAALEALAHAFGVRSRNVRLISGSTARTKIVAIDGDADILSVRLEELIIG